MVDEFPEAFRRFECDVDTRDFDTYRELYFAFESWAGRRWRSSGLQRHCLAIEGRRLGFNPNEPDEFRVATRRRFSFFKPTFRFEVVTVRGKPQNRCRDLKTGRFVKKP
jgi:hypothetical protein